MYEDEVFQPYKTKIIAILEDWFIAIEDGTVEWRHSAPSFAGREGKAYADEDIDRIVAAIDDEVDGEISRNRPHWNAKGIYQGSGFGRLAADQKRALVQEIISVPAPDGELIAAGKKEPVGPAWFSPASEAQATSGEGLAE